LRVYHALLAQRPGDARLRARIESLTHGGSGGGGGETVQAFLRRILAGRLGTEAHTPGSPLDSAFAVAPAESEPDLGGEVSGPGEATRPAADDISLDHVFGVESVSGQYPAQSAPTPTSQPPQPPQPTVPSGGFSFDQFFSPSPPPPSPPRPQGPLGAPSPPGSAPEAPTPAPRMSDRGSGARARPLATEDEADLDQFQAWLRGLKS
jgi:hypothetical protein